MGRHTQAAAQGTGTVSYLWIRSIQMYLFRFIICQSIANDMLKELPADRQTYYTERLRGIDTRAKRDYYGIQNTTDGTT